MSRPFPSRSYHSREPLHRRNGKIRAREVRVLDEKKEQLGVMSLNDALKLRGEPEKEKAKVRGDVRGKPGFQIRRAPGLELGDERDYI